MAAPINLREHTEVQRVFKVGYCLTALAIVASGYLVYFEYLDVSGWISEAQLELICSICASRYTDLQNYDGISGEVYVAVGFLSIFFISGLSFSILLAYANAHRQSVGTSHSKSGESKPVAFAILLVLVMCFVIFFLPTELSTTRYPGSAQLVTGATFPILAAGGVPIVALAIANIAVFIVRRLRP